VTTDAPIVASRALVRPPAACYADCLRADRTVTIDVDRARRQHDAYCAALGACDIVVDALDPHPDLPDACFVEDTAVILGTHAVLTRPGAPPRAGEIASVGAALASTHRCGQLAAGSLDGGDVLVVGRTIFVGLSDRTDAAGAAALEAIAGPLGHEVSTVELRDGLHLKSFVTPIGAREIIMCPGPIEPTTFPDVDVLTTDEPHGGNVLAVNGHVIVSERAPRTAQLLEGRGLVVHQVDVGEFHKGDAGLTCLSLLL
jgi:dimethylargininase